MRQNGGSLVSEFIILGLSTAIWIYHMIYVVFSVQVGVSINVMNVLQLSFGCISMHCNAQGRHLGLCWCSGNNVEP